MIFLIEYDRPSGHIVSFHKFDDSDRDSADQQRLALELDLNKKSIEHEVVVLEAASEVDLRRTHRRYFEKASEIGDSMGSSSIAP